MNHSFGGLNADLAVSNTISIAGYLVAQNLALVAQNLTLMAQMPAFTKTLA